MSEENQTTRLNRQMAWERAKGELRSMYHTYYGNDGRFTDFENEVERFIEKVEFEGLQE